MSIMEMGADECRVCYSYNNSGFDICEDCAKKEEQKRIIKLLKNEGLILSRKLLRKINQDALSGRDD